MQNSGISLNRNSWWGVSAFPVRDFSFWAVTWGSGIDTDFSLCLACSAPTCSCGLTNYRASSWSMCWPKVSFWRELPVPAVKVSGVKVLTFPPGLEESRSRYSAALCSVQLLTCPGKDWLFPNLCRVGICEDISLAPKVLKGLVVLCGATCKDLKQIFIAYKSVQSLKAFQPLWNMCSLMYEFMSSCLLQPPGKSFIRV